MMASHLDSKRLTVGLPAAWKPTESEHALELTVLWGDTVLDSVLVEQARAITAGRKGDLRVEGLAERVATNHGASATIELPAGVQAALRRADGAIVRGLAEHHDLQLDERLVYELGALTVVAQFVRGHGELGPGPRVDWHFPRVFGISILMHSFFITAATMAPNLGRDPFGELAKSDPRFINAILKAPEKKPAKKLELAGKRDAGRHRGPEGKFGPKDKPIKDALASKPGAPRVDPNKRENDRKLVMKMGLLGLMRGPGADSAVSSVLGPGGLGSGINEALGGIRGAALTDAGGAGGLGTRGHDSGGGGNSLGIGGIGRGPGRGGGGDADIDLGQHGKGTTRLRPGKTIILGALSKEEIGRVIRRDLARFKFCYEKELNANPNLMGTVSVYFTIAPTGSVANADIRETSMNDEGVESCVTKVMRTLKFPAPRGGGVVVVTYPFVFAAT